MSQGKKLSPFLIPPKQNFLDPDWSDSAQVQASLADFKEKILLDFSRAFPNTIYSLQVADVPPVKITLKDIQTVGF